MLEYRAMSQLHLYVSQSLADEVRNRAEREGLTVSAFLARLVEKEMGGGWPEGYFERVVGAWRGEPLVRPPQQKVEQRPGLD